MQIIKRNQNKKRFTTAIIHCLYILVLSAIIIVTPSLSFQSQTNSSKYSFNSNANDNDANNSQIAVFSAESGPYGLAYREWTAKWWQWVMLYQKILTNHWSDVER